MIGNKISKLAYNLSILQKLEVSKMEYGYVRVSTKEQNEHRQILALKEYGIAEKQIYMDKQSGKDFERPNYKKMICRLKKRRYGCD